MNTHSFSEKAFNCPRKSPCAARATLSVMFVGVISWRLKEFAMLRTDNRDGLVV